MLVREPKALEMDPILTLIAVTSHGGLASELREGVYEIGHFGSSQFMPGYEHYPHLGFGEYSDSPYGVCDNLDQLLEKYPELEQSDRKFVVTLRRLRKSNQPKQGGWRWHKWGPYIGTQKPQCEFLRDEPEIEEVFCFHVYERLNNT